MKVIELSYHVDRFPLCFYNFYMHVMHDEHHGLWFIDRDVPKIQSHLTAEPCDVKIVKAYISDDAGGLAGNKWVLEFPTDDDYTIFVLRWT